MFAQRGSEENKPSLSTLNTVNFELPSPIERNIEIESKCLKSLDSFEIIYVKTFVLIHKIFFLLLLLLLS